MSDSMLDELRKLVKANADHAAQLLQENVELKKQIADPRPPDHEEWRRKTYFELHEVALRDAREEAEKELRAKLWLETDAGYKSAVARLERRVDELEEQLASESVVGILRYRLTQVFRR